MKQICGCSYPTETVVDGKAACMKCGNEIVKPGEPNSVNIREEDEGDLKFARSIIGNCQQVILKNQRIIDDVLKRYPGLKGSARP